jgi:trehalose-6-phosphate synthase
LGKELGKGVLCPFALDNTWEDCAWRARLREQILEYNILDFSNWQDETEFGKMFRKLVDGLDLYYKQKKNANGEAG